MMLTLRTLLAYIDDTLEPDQARALGRKVAESQDARALIERIKKVTRRRRLHVPVPDGSDDDISDPNTVAEYLNDNLDSAQLKELETTCLASDVHLAEVAACHQILTLVLTEPVRVPPSANQRMYRLVEAPASDHERRPGKAVPVGGVTPVHADADDVDAAFLLGMRRYSAAENPAAQYGLLGAVIAVALFLAVAVWMSLPQPQPRPPETSTDLAALRTAPPPHAGPEIPVAPIPHAFVPKDDNGGKVVQPVDPGIGMKDPNEGKKGPPPVLGDPVQPPLPGQEVVGTMRTANVIVVARGPEPGAAWLRIDGEAPEVRSADPVMAMPGYKAAIELKSDVLVHLWGNIPEQVAMKSMVMQSRVRFHPPAKNFDADLTLEAGRIYLASNKKGTGAKIRVRFAGETWDIALADEKSEVMVQVHAAYVPGTPYARKDGEKPRTEARLAVVRGTASFNAPARFKKYESIAAWTELSWDSKSGTLSEPKKLEPNDPSTVRIALIAGDQGIAVQKVLSDAALKLTDRAGIQIALKSRINYVESRENILPTMIAIYGYAAIADGPDTQNLVADLYDELAERGRVYARRAAVMAVSGWLARDAGNTALFFDVVTRQKQVPEEDADLIAHLLRGYSSREKNNPEAVDRLVEFLDHPNLIVREAALGNLLAFFDPEAAAKPELGGLNVAGRGEPGYEKALRSWKTWAEELKKKMMEKK